MNTRPHHPGAHERLLAGAPAGLGRDAAGDVDTDEELGGLSQLCSAILTLVKACNVQLQLAISSPEGQKAREEALARAEAVYQVTLELMSDLCTTMRRLAVDRDARDPAMQAELDDAIAIWSANLRVCEDMRETLRYDIARIRHVQSRDRNHQWAAGQVQTLIQGAGGSARPAKR